MSRSKEFDIDRARVISGARRVRCLGPGEEHLFWSVSPAENRICTACRLHLSTTVFRHMTEHEVMVDRGRRPKD